MKRLLTTCAGALLFLFALPTNASANTIFTTSINEIYAFDYERNAHVTRDFILKAEDKNIVPDSFTLAVGQEKVENITVHSLDAEIPFEVQNSGLKVLFPKELILAPTQPFKIAYDAFNLVEMRGAVHTFHIPLVPTTELIGIASYKVEIQYPSSWGDVMAASGAVETFTEGEMRKAFITLKPFSQSTMLRVMVGTPQLYDVSLKYELQNTYGNRHFYEVAFPPEIDMQRVFIKKINPTPSSIWVDEDGNFMAGYWLKAKERKTIIFEGQIEIGALSPPEETISPIENMPRYLLPDQYWESNNEQIQSLASQLVTPENIYRYVSKTLLYNSNRITQDGIERNGAVWALENPSQAACMEFTDLTIALMRSAGIPAREINGYAYVSQAEQNLETQAKDVLHAWVQYWDEAVGWVHIDPTWGASTGEDYFNAFDTDHLIFVIKGITSQRPFPAGSYRFDATYEDQHIFVELASEKDPKITPYAKWIDEYLQSQIPWWKRIWQFFTFG